MFYDARALSVLIGSWLGIICVAVGVMYLTYRYRHRCTLETNYTTQTAEERRQERVQAFVQKLEAM